MKKSTKEFLMFLFEMIGVSFPLVLGIYFIPKTTTFEETCIVFFTIMIFEIVWIIPFTQIIVTKVRKRYNCERPA